MKLHITALLTATVHAHSIFQRVSINGEDQGLLTGLRAPENDFPVQNVNDPNMACGQPGTHSDVVLSVEAGDKLGAFWGHVIGGAQWPGDPAEYIDKSHKGPIMYYMARVDDAATSDHAGLEWFKIHEDAFDHTQGIWAVDQMIADKGWSYATVPECLAPGQYLLRVELLALHSAYDLEGAQFYQSCAQLEVSGSGEYVPEETVPIPGLYKQDDPSIHIQIWVNGVDNNGLKPYSAPGPAPMTC